MMPKIVLSNKVKTQKHLKTFAQDLGFSGVDWTLTPHDFPKTRQEELFFIKSVRRLFPLEVRFHLFFPDYELGNANEVRADMAKKIHFRALELISKVGGNLVTTHIGIDMNSRDNLSWDRTITNLREVRDKARFLGINLCLENLAVGWTANPLLYRSIIQQAGCNATLDIGHVHAVTTNLPNYNMSDYMKIRERVRNAHIYYTERASQHIAPKSVSDVWDMLTALIGLPLCDWWVLELTEEESLMQTYGCIKEFLGCWMETAVS